ncbi:MULTISPECIES: polysaccharide deacetylase family protein [unclassified Gemella]|uniref:polysaccharide deacetylase family protein n=1 Tax=unclassified Gemella TaxID=2624949 RepID=UPI0010749D0D|nr:MULTISPECIES: polysaccharide deacetylase family protein [unclassified Gemella]MBF0710054.1 polysaccharide deacetylase [Gemella sp. GL1.1]MBF0746133.1 polysaccharide deacetylase [Gemella sp. 19428wG2_WT2a]NYS27398.1 polysaccharide deacetylase [Gemella sp. GL1]TFU60422.1 polysaccharide deacetylase [Gemella sp. WT2a]
MKKIFLYILTFATMGVLLFGSYTLGKNIIYGTNPTNNLLITTTTEFVDKDNLKKGSNHNLKADEYAYKTSEINSYIKGESQTDKKLVFLTFDDGVDTLITPQILDILKEHQVPATFFVVGQYVTESAKDIMTRQIREGHAIGIHSYTHNIGLLYPYMVGNTPVILQEFKDTQDAIKNILGNDYFPSVWRYPGGAMSWSGLETVDTTLKAQGIENIDWNLMNGDAESPLKKPQTPEQMMTYLHSSGQYYPETTVKVVLMHDTVGREITVETLPRIIKYFKDQGYEFGILE